MAEKRKDTWKPADDELLASLVLKYIREGSTQLAAFSAASQALDRSQQACGFRWNSAVRKNHEQAIQEAKNVRLKLRAQKRGQTLTEEYNPSSVESEKVDAIELHFPELLHSLQQLMENFKVIQQENTVLKQENEQLKQKIVESATSSNGNDLEDLTRLVAKARELGAFDIMKGSAS